MIAYLDSSVLLRFVLGQSGALEQWGRIATGVGSMLVRVECLRALDRLRLTERLDSDELSLRRKTVFELTDRMRLLDVDRAVLERASQPFPTPLGTLDAIHLAGAILYRAEQEETLVMATHDRGLGLAAASMGFDVIGAEVSRRS